MGEEDSIARGEGGGGRGGESVTWGRKPGLSTKFAPALCVN